MKDWTGNKKSMMVQIGASNHTDHERADNDFYATEPKALELLLEKEKFSSKVYECACGEGHLSEVLKKHGYRVISTDLIDRGYGIGGIDFLTTTFQPFDGDIITNPPYKYALEFVKKAYDTVTEGHKVAMFLRIQFLEGKERRKFFETTPPKKVIVSTSRLRCALNGDFVRYGHSNAATYAWFIWIKGSEKTAPIIDWFN